MKDVVPHVVQADDREQQRESVPTFRGRGRGRGGGFAARGFAAAGLTRQHQQSSDRQQQGDRKPNGE